MKKTAEEIIARINDLELDDEIKIELMEDVKDSVTDADPEAEARYTELEAKYNDLLERYKTRFMEGKDPEDDPGEDEEEDAEIIDIKEI